MLGLTQFLGLECSIFGVFGRVCSSVLVDKTGFKRVQSSVFQDLVLGSTHFWPNRFNVWAFWRGLNGFEVQFWWMNLGSSEFKV